MSKFFSEKFPFPFCKNQDEVYNYVMENIITTNGSLGSWLASLPAEVWGFTSVVAMFGLTAIMAVLIVWTIVWKGLALWKAARAGSKIWFIILLIVNTVGILEIIYYFFVAPKQEKK